MVRTWGKRTAAAAIVAAAVLAGACSGDDDERSSMALARGDETEESSAGGAVAADSAATSGGGDASATGSGGGSTASVVPASVSLPRIIKTATLRVEVGDGEFSKAFSDVATIASSVNGFVASSTSAAGGDDELASGTLTLRVPSASFDEVRQRVRGLGELNSEEIRGDDVGGQIADLEARLRNLRAQEEAIRALMSRTNNVQETLQIQNQLGTVREQIEQLDAQRVRLEDQVSYATLTVQLFEPGAAPKGEKSSIAKAFSQALDGAESITAGAIVALGYLFPVALVALIALAIRRALVRPAAAAAPVSGEHGA